MQQEHRSLRIWLNTPTQPNPSIFRVLGERIRCSLSRDFVLRVTSVKEYYFLLQVFIFYFLVSDERFRWFQFPLSEYNNPKSTITTALVIFRHHFHL